MDVYLILLLLAIIVVSLVDISGFIDTVKRVVWKWVWKNNQREYSDFSFRPFDCSYCMTHHIGVIYLILTSSLSILHYAFLLVLCMLTPVIKDGLLLIKAILQRMIDMVWDYLEL